MGSSSKPYRRRLLRAAAVVGAFLGTGCAVPWTGKDGTRHHLIVGLGFVTTQASSNQPVQVTRSVIAGLDVGGAPHFLRAGVGSSLTTRVADNVSNVVLNASLLPGGRIRVETLSQTQPSKITDP
jgi:hypothetical protein